jgi:hypothetical protein
MTFDFAGDGKAEMSSANTICEKPTMDDAKLIRKALIEEMPSMKQYSVNAIYKHIVTLDDYKTWVWENKIYRICPAPYCYHIKTGAFIADEMKGQVIGLFKERKSNGDFAEYEIMDKYEWRYIDEDNLQAYKLGMVRTIKVLANTDWSDPERVYWVVNTEELEADDSDSEDENESLDEETIDALDAYIIEHGVLPDDVDEYVLERFQLHQEIEADILRGK